MTYGGSVPTITAGYAGFVNGDSSSSLTTKPTCATTATSSSPVSGSPYASSCGGAVDPNYTISYFGGSVTVSTATLTITASSPTMTYGGSVPTITPGYTGFVNGDSSSSLTTKPTCSTTATSSSPVSGSPYASSCSGAADPNYIVQLRGRLGHGEQGAADHHRLDGSMTYGGSVPTITPGYSGFVNGDSVSSLSTQPTCSTTATSASPVTGSPYASSCSGATDPELHHQLRGRLGYGDQGTADHHRLERLHDLRRHGAHHHRGLRRLRQRRHCVVPHDQADLLDDGDQCQFGHRLALRLVLFGCRRTPTTPSVTWPAR